MSYNSIKAMWFQSSWHFLFILFIPIAFTFSIPCENQNVCIMIEGIVDINGLGQYKWLYAIFSKCTENRFHSDPKLDRRCFVSPKKNKTFYFFVNSYFVLHLWRLQFSADSCRVVHGHTCAMLNCILIVCNGN